MVKLALEENVLHIQEDTPPAKQISLRLDALRLVILFVPPRFKGPGVETTAQQSLVDLERPSDQDLPALLEQLSTRGAGLGETRLFLEDYRGQYASISLQDAQANGIDLLAELSRYRQVRREKLAGWARNSPGLIITGAQGDRITLNPVGARLGAADSVAWADLDRIEIKARSAEKLSAYHFIPRQEQGSQTFSVRMPEEKAALFTAECTFWRSLAGRELPRPF